MIKISTKGGFEQQWGEKPWKKGKHHRNEEFIRMKNCVPVENLTDNGAPKTDASRRRIAPQLPQQVSKISGVVGSEEGKGQHKERANAVSRKRSVPARLKEGTISKNFARQT